MSVSNNDSERNYHKCEKDFRVMFPLFLSHFNETWILLADFRGKNPHLSNFMEIRPVAADYFHVDGGTDRHDEAYNSISQFSGSFKKNIPRVKLD